MFGRKKKIFVEIIHPAKYTELKKIKITDENKIELNEITINFKPSDFLDFKYGFLKKGRKIIVGSKSTEPLRWDEDKKELGKMQLWLTRKQHKTWIEVENAKSKMKEKPFSNTTLIAIISMLGIILFISILTANRLGVFR